MIPRSQLGPAEVHTLHAHLDRKLQEIGIETQPKVALRLIELASDSQAQIKDYADIIKSDSALTGRIIRLANSAFYAQRTEVTRIDRALVLLGIERTKAITMGFYMSRSLMGAGTRDLTRRVWGQSLYRASLAASLARNQCSHLVPEAYIIGLMLDSGVPLMGRILGDSYTALWNQQPSPAKLLQAETDQLEFNHVDVVEALLRRWRMPTVLAKPIMWHHTPPSVGKTSDATTLLHRVAYYAGAVQLRDGTIPGVNHHLPTVAGRLFDINPADLDQIVTAASTDYLATIGLFSPGPGEAAEVDHLENLADTVQNQLIEMIDEQMGRSARAEERGGPETLVLDGLQFDIEPGRQGEVVAYISSLRGERLMSCVVKPHAESAPSLKRILGLEDADEAEVQTLIRAMRAMAA